LSYFTSRLTSLPPPLGSPSTPKQQEALMEEAKRIGEDYLALEKYVNLNYMVRTFWRRELTRGLL
jgi:hypothetical protein